MFCRQQLALLPRHNHQALRQHPVLQRLHFITLRVTRFLPTSPVVRVAAGARFLLAARESGCCLP